MPLTGVAIEIAVAFAIIIALLVIRKVVKKRIVSFSLELLRMGNIP